MHDDGDNNGELQMRNTTRAEPKSSEGIKYQRRYLEIMDLAV